MSRKLPTSLEELLAAVSPTAKPSIELAKMVLNPLLDNTAGDVPSFDFMEHDSHPEYFPSFDEVFKWAMKSLSEANQLREALGPDKDNEVHFPTAVLDDFLAGHIGSEQLIEEVAGNFSFVDADAFFGGTVAMKCWHAARVAREAYRIYNYQSEVVDAVLAVPLAKLTHSIQQLERLQAGQEVQDNKDGTFAELDQAIDGMQELLNRTPQIVDAGLRMGFLYRDAWWIENHGEVTVKGYLSKMRSAKAGESGGRKSNKMRMQRIKYFLAEHAKLISTNPILRDDPPEDVAYRAVKIAAKKHPEAFRRGASKRSAREYWEYILSDQDLLDEYESLMITEPYGKNA